MSPALLLSLDKKLPCEFWALKEKKYPKRKRKNEWIVEGLIGLMGLDFFFFFIL